MKQLEDYVFITTVYIDVISVEIFSGKKNNQKKQAKPTSQYIVY